MTPTVAPTVAMAANDDNNAGMMGRRRRRRRRRRRTGSGRAPARTSKMTSGRGNDNLTNDQVGGAFLPAPLDSARRRGATVTLAVAHTSLVGAATPSAPLPWAPRQHLATPGRPHSRPCSFVAARPSFLMTYCLSICLHGPDLIRAIIHIARALPQGIPERGARQASPARPGPARSRVLGRERAAPAPATRAADDNLFPTTRKAAASPHPTAPVLVRMRIGAPISHGRRAPCHRAVAARLTGGAKVS